VQNPAQLQAVRARLASQRLTAPLFDTPRFARNLERAFGQMYDRHCQGVPAGDFDVADTVGM